MIAIFASIIHKHDQIQRTLKKFANNTNKQFAHFCCLKIPEGQDEAIFPAQGNGVFIKTPLLNKVVRSRLLNIVNNMDIYALNCILVYEPVKWPISNQFDHS